MVREIFFSIQGESTHAGRPCVFVRLAGCNLDCVWCDTDYAVERSEKMTTEQVLDAVAAYPCRLVEITGGEPLFQDASLELMKSLCDKGYEVLLETSGAVDISQVDTRVVRIMDIKCPGSGMSDRNRWENLDRLTSSDEVKMVIADRGDYEWAAGVVRDRGLADVCTVLFAPVFGQLDAAQLAEWILEDGLPVRYQLQLHKVIWGPDKRGV